jgi:hypothetical protein
LEMGPEIQTDETMLQIGHEEARLWDAASYTI